MKQSLFFIFLLAALQVNAQSPFPLYIPDDFSVTDKMLTINRKKIVIEGFFLDEFVFFKSIPLNQTLAFELYTDNHRFKTYLFYNNNISYELTKLLHLPIKNDNTLKTRKERVAAFEKVLTQATEISTKHFTSNKGIALGDSKEKVSTVYGFNYIEKTSESCNGNCEICIWKFNGELSDGKQELPIAQGSFGHEATMVFEDDKLIIMVLLNEIP